MKQTNEGIKQKAIFRDSVHRNSLPLLQLSEELMLVLWKVQEYYPQDRAAKASMAVVLTDRGNPYLLKFVVSKVTNDNSVDEILIPVKDVVIKNDDTDESVLSFEERDGKISRFTLKSRTTNTIIDTTYKGSKSGSSVKARAKANKLMKELLVKGDTNNDAKSGNNDNKEVNQK